MYAKRPVPPSVVRIDNPLACGMGRGPDCCIYLTALREGIVCTRDSTDPAVRYVRRTIERRHFAGLMRSDRMPDEPRPECQIYQGVSL